MSYKDITYEQVYALVHYDQNTGKLFWRKRDESLFPTIRSAKIWNSRFSNKEAFTAICSKTSVRKGSILGKSVNAHDVAWILSTGAWPVKPIEHKNGDRSDNRLRNLQPSIDKEIVVKSRSDVTPDILRMLLYYDPETGILTWLSRSDEFFSSVSMRKKWNARYAGNKALTATHPHGYHVGGILGFDFLAHRVAWAIHHQEWPKGEIDHINGDPSDNRIENLRDVDHGTNMQNMKIHKSNNSGHVGVCWDNHYSKWLATIWSGNKQISIGRFDDKIDAIQARVKAEKELGYHENHGRTR